MEIVANGECFSIVSDYLGTPMQAYDKQGDKVWEQDCITIVSATTTRMQGVTSVKIR